MKQKSERVNPPSGESVLEEEKAQSKSEGNDRDISARDVIENNSRLIRGYPEEIQAIKDELQRELGSIEGFDSHKPVVATGHQAIFFHPGILAKETMAADIAALSGANALTIVLDNDPSELFFTYPVFRPDTAPYRGGEARVEEIRVEKLSVSLGRSFMGRKLINRAQGELWEKMASTMPNHLKGRLSQKTLEQVEASFDTCLRLRESYGDLADYITHCRLQDPPMQKYNIIPVKVSFLTKTRAWAMFCETIIRNHEKFRREYNGALESYRRERHVKNHAQPAPNLMDGEIPFWSYYEETGGREKTFYGESLKGTRGDKGGVGERILLPRAVTLSLFLRLFLSDLFIHGMGGQKYDIVTNRIVTQFYGVEPPKFLVKSRTLKLSLDPSSPLNGVQAMEALSRWRERYRNFEYHGEKMLDEGHPLRVERQMLIREFHESEGSKLRLHQSLEENRRHILSELNQLDKKFRLQEKEIRRLRRDTRALNDRAMPYFFYDWQ